MIPESPEPALCIPPSLVLMFIQRSTQTGKEIKRFVHCYRTSSKTCMNKQSFILELLWSLLPKTNAWIFIATSVGQLLLYWNFQYKKIFQVYHESTVTWSSSRCLHRDKKEQSLNCLDLTGNLKGKKKSTGMLFPSVDVCEHGYPFWWQGTDEGAFR